MNQQQSSSNTKFDPSNRSTFSRCGPQATSHTRAKLFWEPPIALERDPPRDNFLPRVPQDIHGGRRRRYHSRDRDQRRALNTEKESDGKRSWKKPPVSSFFTTSARFEVTDCDQFGNSFSHFRKTPSLTERARSLQEAYKIINPKFRRIPFICRNTKKMRDDASKLPTSTTALRPCILTENGISFIRKQKTTLDDFLPEKKEEPQLSMSNTPAVSEIIQQIDQRYSLGNSSPIKADGSSIYDSPSIFSALSISSSHCLIPFPNCDLSLKNPEIGNGQNHRSDQISMVSQNRRILTFKTENLQRTRSPEYNPNQQQISRNRIARQLNQRSLTREVSDLKPLETECSSRAVDQHNLSSNTGVTAEDQLSKYRHESTVKPPQSLTKYLINEGTSNRSFDGGSKIIQENREVQDPQESLTKEFVCANGGSRVVHNKTNIEDETGRRKKAESGLSQSEDFTTIITSQSKLRLPAGTDLKNRSPTRRSFTGSQTQCGGSRESMRQLNRGQKAWDTPSGGVVVNIYSTPTGSQLITYASSSTYSLSIQRSDSTASFQLSRKRESLSALRDKPSNGSKRGPRPMCHVKSILSKKSQDSRSSGGSKKSGVSIIAADKKRNTSAQTSVCSLRSIPSRKMYRQSRGSPRPRKKCVGSKCSDCTLRNSPMKRNICPRKNNEPLDKEISLASLSNNMTSNQIDLKKSDYLRGNPSKISLTIRCSDCSRKFDGRLLRPRCSTLKTSSIFGQSRSNSGSRTVDHSRLNKLVQDLLYKKTSRSRLRGLDERSNHLKLEKQDSLSKAPNLPSDQTQRSSPGRVAHCKEKSTHLKKFWRASRQSGLSNQDQRSPSGNASSSETNIQDTSELSSGSSHSRFNNRGQQALSSGSSYSRLKTDNFKQISRTSSKSRLSDEGQKAPSRESRNSKLKNQDSKESLRRKNSLRPSDPDQRTCSSANTGVFQTEDVSKAHHSAVNASLRSIGPPLESRTRTSDSLIMHTESVAVGDSNGEKTPKPEDRVKLNIPVVMNSSIDPPIVARTTLSSPSSGENPLPTTNPPKTENYPKSDGDSKEQNSESKRVTPFLRVNICTLSSPCLAAVKCSNGNPCYKTEPCSERTPCLKSRICTNAQPCTRTDACSKDHPCLTMKGCSVSHPCLKINLCSMNNPCGKTNACQRKTPCLRTLQDSRRSQTTFRKICACSKRDPCLKIAHCTRVEPCFMIDTCQLQKPCLKETVCSRSSPCARRIVCLRKAPCMKTKHCGKKFPCLGVHTCSNLDPCLRLIRCTRRKPCMRPSFCSKVRPCLKKTTCTKKNPCLRMDPCLRGIERKSTRKVRGRTSMTSFTNSADDASISISAKTSKYQRQRLQKKLVKICSSDESIVIRCFKEKEKEDTAKGRKGKNKKAIKIDSGMCFRTSAYSLNKLPSAQSSGSTAENLETVCEQSSGNSVESKSKSTCALKPNSKDTSTNHSKSKASEYSLEATTRAKVCIDIKPSKNNCSEQKRIRSGSDKFGYRCTTCAFSQASSMTEESRCSTPDSYPLKGVWSEKTTSLHSYEFLQKMSVEKTCGTESTNFSPCSESCCATESCISDSDLSRYSGASSLTMTIIKS